jgi:hypothetical protein
VNAGITEPLIVGTLAGTISRGRREIAWQANYLDSDTERAQFELNGKCIFRQNDYPRA